MCEIAEREAQKPVPMRHCFNCGEELGRYRALTQGEGSEPVVEAVACRYRFKQGGWSGWHVETSEDEVKLNLALRQKSGWIEEYEVEPLYASPPPLPAGNADPRVREALGTRTKDLGRGLTNIYVGTVFVGQVQYQSGFKGTPQAYRCDLASWLLPDRSAGGLGWGSAETLSAAADMMRVRLLDALCLTSPQSQGLVEAAEWRSMENAPRKDGTQILINTGDYIGVYRYSSGNKIYDFKTWQPEGNARHGHIFANDYGERGCKWLPLDLPAALRSRASDRSP